MRYQKDNTKEYRRDMVNLQVGDIAFNECDQPGMGTGGYTYDAGEKVVGINNTEIITQDPSDNSYRYYDRETLKAIKTKATAYYLHGFQRGYGRELRRVD